MTLRWSRHGVYDRAHLDAVASRWAGVVWPMDDGRWGWSAGQREGTAPTKRDAQEAVRLALGVRG